MATISFTKDFSITKKENVDRLEKGAASTKSLKLDSQRVLGHMQRGEKIIGFASFQSFRVLVRKEAVEWLLHHLTKTLH